VISLAALVLIAGLATWLIRPDWPGATNPGAASFSGPAPSPPLTGIALRDKAQADLQQKLDRLPTTPTPPLNTFYYDLSVDMRKMISPRIPWTAIIRGGENTVNPDTNETLSRTEFTLQAEYRDGVWTYISYRGVVAIAVDSSSAEIEHHLGLDTPPTLVGMLGLKTIDAPAAPMSIMK
jgi:hypothetical protein